MRTPRWLMLFLAIGAIFAMLAFSACGSGDDDDDNGGGTSATATASSNGGNGSEGSRTPTAEATDSGDDGGSEQDIFGQLDALTGDLESATGKISYNITNEDGTTSSYTVYAKPPNSRYDIDTSILIFTPETTYTCDTSSEACFSTEGTGEDNSSALGSLGAFFSPEVIAGYAAAAEAAGINVDRSDESINGIDATCFSWEDDPAASVDAGKMCFNDAGLGVYYEFTSDSGTTIMEATDYSSDVPDSDFEPPYDVTDLSSLGN